MTLDSEFSKGRSLIVHGRTNTSLQAINLNSSCSKQAHSNRLGIGHGYKNTESKLYSHSTPCFICNSSIARHQTGAQYSVVKYARDRAAVHNVLARHPIFASRLSSVTRENTIFYVLPLNRDKKLAICLVLPKNKSGPGRMVKVYSCYKPLAHVWPLDYLNERLHLPPLKD